MFESNTADLSGGAISSSNLSSITIDGSLFLNNNAIDKARGEGGSLELEINSTAFISNVRFLANIAQNGGAVFTVQFSNITVYNSIFEANTESAIHAQYDVFLTISKCNFIRNLASLTGGAIYHRLSRLNITDTVFSENKATSGGGSFYVVASTEVSCNNCSFTDNFAFKGGALAAVNSNVRLSASNFTRNSAVNGGGFAIGGIVILKQCTMNNNTAHGNGSV